MLNCTSCGEENRPNAKFCQECGTPITRACVNCEHPLSPSAKFCDECGTPTAASAATAAPPPDDGAVRRTVTIMFADLVGSTAFGESVDAESARREMGAYHELTRSVIEAHGGEVVKFIGDGVMAGFGISEVAEDDADRAVRAGIELQREFVSVIDGIRDRHGAEVNLRVGINTGEVVIAEDDADMIGDAINTAARIEAQCTPGRVLVGEQTWRLTRAGVDYEVLGEVEVKGKAEPIATFQVLAAVEDEEIATPFVGREAELATLTAELEDTIAASSPQLVTVIGSPGVGKTRLAAQLADRASEVTSFDLRVDRAGATTFQPIADLLREVADLPAGLTDDETALHLANFVGEIDDQARLVPLLSGFVGAAPPRSTEESLWAARRLVELVVAERPAVIVVDDIQWAEPLFLDLLEHLVEWVEGAAFIVALARPEIREIRPAFAEVGRRVSEVISLEGLDTETMSELATGILGGKPLPEELATRLPDSTEGNPLFVRELVRMLVDDGTITETATGWVLAIDADAVEVPPTIISLLASRVERMGDDERRVVEAAGVVGSEFPRGAVDALLPDLGQAQLDRVLERLRRQEIVDPTGNYWGDEPVWRFHHVLIRDAAYRRLLKERRASMHRIAGEWTETTAAGLSGEHEISIAFHFEQAHGYLRELGPLDDAASALGARAVDLLTTAADRALARDDLAAAGSLATRALAILPPDSDRRPELLLAACEAWFSAGRVRDGFAHLEELRTVDSDERVTAWTAAFEGQYVVLTDPDRLAEIEPTVADAAARLADLGDDAGVAKARLVRALILARTGRVGLCEEELDAALAAARAADDRRRITAVLGAAPLAALWGPSPVARAGGRCLDIIRLLRITSASPMVEAVSIRCQAVLEAMRGRFDEARTLLGRSLAIVEELGLRHGILEARMFAGYIELLAGDAAAAEPHLRVAYAGLGTLGVGADAGQAAALLSQALLELGHIEEAAELADESASLAGQNLQAAIASRAAQGRVAAAKGRPDDAYRLAMEAVTMAARTDLTMDHANAVAGLALVHAAAGNRADSTKAETEAQQIYDAKGAVVGHATAAMPASRASAKRVESDRITEETDPEISEPERLGREFWRRLYDDLDVDRAVELVADTVDDQRSMMQVLNKAQLTEISRASLEGVEWVDYEVEYLAYRGADAALNRVKATYRPNDFEREIFTVSRAVDGLLTQPSVFDSFDEAYAELERLYREHEGAEFVETLQLMKEFRRRIDEAEPKLEEPIVHPRAVLRDHRSGLNFEALIADAAREYFAQQIRGRSFDTRLHRLSDRGIVAEVSGTYADDDSFNTELSATRVVLIDRGLITRYEFFDEGEVDAACARFDELTAGQPPSEFERVNREFWRRLFEDLDVDAAMSLYHGGVGDRRRFMDALDRDQLTAYLRNALEGVESVDYSVEIHATRGDDLGLLEVWCRYAPSGLERSIFTVSGLVNGLSADSEIFDNLDDAYVEMERRYREGDGAEFAEVLDAISAQIVAQAANDSEAGLPLTTDDCFFVDHRPLLRLNQPLREVVDAHLSIGYHGRIIIEDYVRLTADGAVTYQIDDMRDANGVAAAFDTCVVRIVRDGKLARWEIYPRDEVDAALARFDELTTAPELQNRATKSNAEFFERLSRGEFEGAAELLGENWGTSDERGLNLVKLDSTTATAWFGEPDRSFTTKPIAIRGANLALILMMSTEAATPGTHVLIVSEVDEGGRALRDEIFEPSDLRPALDRLNEWYIEDEGAPYRETIELAWNLGKAMELEASEQVAALAELTHPDVQINDRRSISLPTIRRDDLANADSPIIHSQQVVVSEYIAINDRGMLNVQESRFLNDVGGAVTNNHLTMIIGGAGKANHIEWFNLDDREAALARFDELTSRDDETFELANAATQLTHIVFSTLYDDFDVDASLAVTHPDSRLVDHRTFTPFPNGDHSQLRDFLLATLDGIERMDWNLATIAIRGDNLALSQVTVDFFPANAAREFLYLAEVIDGLVVGEMFEVGDLRAAMDQLNERYIAGEGAPYRDIVKLKQAGGTANGAADDGALKRILSPDFVHGDHRRFGTGVQEGDDLVQDGLTEEGVDVGVKILEIDTNAILGLDTVHRTIADGGAVEWRHISLMAGRDGLLTNAEYFDETDLEAAVARFDEVTARTTPSRRAKAATEDLATAKFEELTASPANDPFENDASRTMRAINEAMCDDRDLDATLSLLHDDFFCHDNRAVIGASFGKDDWEQSLLPWYSGKATESWSQETLATRGDRFVLTRFTTVGPISHEVLVCAEVDEAGLYKRAAWFDADQRAEADTMLARWWTESLDADAIDTLIHLGALGAASGNRDAIDARFAPDMTFKDHDVWRFDGFNREQVIDGFIFMAEAIGVAMHEYTAIPRLNEHGILTAERQAAQDESVEWWYCTVHLRNDEGLVTHIEYFPYDQLGSAIERFDELTDSPPDPFANLASSWARSTHDLGDALTIATSGEQTALFHHIGADALHVAIVDANGETGTLQSFAGDDLDAAVDALKLGHGDTLGPDHRAFFETSRRFARAIRDSESLDEVLSPEFAYVDHRRVAYPDLERDEFIAVTADQYKTTFARRVLAYDGVHTVTEQAIFDQTYDFSSTMLISIRDGQALRMETWDPDAEAAALARFEELSSEGAAERATAPALFNAATMQVDRFCEAFTQGNLDALVATTHDDFQAQSHTSVVYAWSRDELGTLWGQELASQDGARWDNEVLAIDGQRLALIRMTVIAGATGFETTAFTVNELAPDGRLSRTWAYGDDLEAARARFAFRARALSDPTRRGNATTNRWTEAWRRRMDDGDRSPLDTILAAATIEDQRTDRSIDPFASTVDTDDIKHAADLLMWQWDTTGVVRHSFEGIEGADHLASLYFDHGDNHLAVTLFDATETDQAKVAFGDALRRLWPDEHQLMIDMLTPFADGWAERDHDKVKDCLTGDYVFVDFIDHFEMTLDQYLDSVDANEEIVGAQRIWTSSYHVISEHGMVLTGRIETDNTDGFAATWEFLLLHLWNGERYTRTEMYPAGRLVETIERFHELTKEATQPSGPHRTTAERIADEMFDAFMDGDVERFTAYFAEDFENDNRRAISQGPVSPGDFSAAAASWRGFYPSSAESTVATRGELHAVTRVDQLSADGFETGLLLALEFNEKGKLRRLTLFDADTESGEADAIATIDEWWAATLDADQRKVARLTTEREAPDNTAARITIAEIRAMYVDKFLPPWDPTITTDDRSGIRAFDLDNEANFKNWFEEFVVPFEIEVTETVLATSGDDLALIRYSLDVSESPFPVEYLSLTRTDDDRIRETVLFDADHEAEARAELDAWAARR